ncbi:MAG: efflux RND transporter periplasmic adaptor subunit [Methylobacter sp.]|uniref:efflux RND transporter periplasmic adaptor subunit n=1 Tax=Methylobacter sp. TaxID=2051955 RepID=UPI00272FBCDB|nr:efflux RND transporter periplasmic adaptor subunit [Methylobacter sp.]MDP1663520.1 efflux RND transporter periplasmic adaptor subunit [Methylobacter sp.]
MNFYALVQRGSQIKSGLAICTVSLALLAACGQSEEPAKTDETIRPVKQMKVGGSLAGKTRKLPGTVRASDRVDLAFQVPGPLVELPVKEGQRVKKGTLVARIDPRDYDTNLRNAEGGLAKAEAGLTYAIAEYHRYVKVKQTDAGAVSDSMVALKLASEKVARAELKSAKATVTAARDQLGYTRLKAPFDGVIARKHVDNYQEVQAKEVILSLQNVKDVEVLIDVPELMIAPIRKTEPRFYAELAADSNRRYELQVKEFATQADSVTQTYRVVLVMPAPTGIRVLPGMTVDVSIEFTEETEGGAEILIPAIAVIADSAGKPQVWVIDPQTQKVQRRAVTTGDLSGSDSIRIVSGLNPDETIAVSGVSKLREGQRVRALE